MSDKANERVTVRKELRDFFSPMSKTYMQRVLFFVLYCAFLGVSFATGFLERFRVGGAFVGVFIGMGIVMPWIEYSRSMKAIEERWPTKERQEELYEDFAAAESVFRGEGKIGKKYSFWKKDATVLPTVEVRDFVPARVRAGVQMRAVLMDGVITVAQFPYDHKDLQELAQMLDDAKDCLKRHSA